MKKLKHAIIGCGRIAQNHFNAASFNNMEVVACCDIDIEKAKQFAGKNNIPKYVKDYRELINNDEIDSVSICTDHYSHTIIAKDFINKKHMIIEKSFSNNMKGVNDFLELNKNNKKIVTVISQHRFDLLVNVIKKMVDNKDLGNITLVNAELICHRTVDYYKDSYWRGTHELEGGSTIINQSFHIVDTINYLFGIPQEVKTYKDNFEFKGIIDTEDTCVSILKYNNFLCTISSTNTTKEEWLTKIKIIGTKGFVEFNIDFPEEITEITINTDKYKKELEQIKINYKENINKPVNYYGLSHIKQFANFKEAILDNSKLKVSVNDAKDTQQIIEMIYNG